MSMKSASLTLEPVSRLTLRHGGAITAAKARSTRSDAYGFAIGAAIVAAVRGLLAWGRYMKMRHEQWREARATYESLRHLDDRALRDLGIDRLEISSVAAEASGDAERTRSLAFVAI